MSTIKTDTLQNVAGTKSVPVNTVVDGSAKAWVNFNGTGTVAIRAAFNVSSITDNGVGSYTVNFTTAMPDTNYSAVFGGDGQATVNITALGVRAFNTTSCQLDVGSVGTSSAIPSDRISICAAFFR